jgi:hypothetical protein
MIIRKARPRTLGLNEPIRHEVRTSDPSRGATFLAQGFTAGLGTVIGADDLQPVRESARRDGALSPDLEALQSQCGIDVLGAGKIPFICIDLAGGANMVGSNVLIGGRAGSSIPVDRGLRQARPAGRHAAEHDQPDDAARASPTRGSVSRSTATARSCAASRIASRRRPRRASTVP